MLENIRDFFVNYGLNILIAICLLIIGGIAIFFLNKLLKKILYKTSVDNSVVTFITSFVKIALWIILIFVVAGILNLSTSSLVVCLSSVALAIGLALKDSLSNLANGIFIIYNKPFKRGDHIAIDNVEGSIQNITLFCIELLTFDNKKLIIPNSKCITQTITNYTAMPTRRISQTFGVSYDSDVEFVQKVLLKRLQKEDKILKNPAISVYLSKHDNSSLNFTIKFWVGTTDFWTMENGLPKIVYDVFKENNINIPYNQLDVHFDKEVIKNTSNENKNNIVNKEENN